MPSSGTLLTVGVVLLAAAGVEYFGVLSKFDAPLRAALGPALPFAEMIVALLGLACLAGSFFNQGNA